MIYTFNIHLAVNIVLKMRRNIKANFVVVNIVCIFCFPLFRSETLANMDLQHLIYKFLIWFSYFSLIFYYYLFVAVKW